MAETATVDQLMLQIADKYPTLSKQLKIIAKYIEQHRTSLMLERISDIAEHCDVQPSAIVRFAKQFGFTGFSEMQAVFRDAYTAQTGPSPNYQQRIRKLIETKASPLQSGAMAREFIDASRSGLDELLSGLDETRFEEAVKLLHKAENIYVIGVRRSFPIATYIVYALQHTNKRVHILSGLGGMFREQIRSIGKNDVLIAISFTPYGKETQACVRLAHHHQAKTLVITDSQLSPLAKHATVSLTVKEGSAFAFRSLTNAMCLCQALFIALAYRLELNVEEANAIDGYDE
ncbi:MurR/RpiR family transcriptional regulator [Glaciimonas immobilis]|uniref:DNA-binding MurR/RpiR family transcriptional regulator n=1 Tax=Glaciimonas immobilis TaxID=728004 RepID=A0A840RKE9_9BURK|nr:MurR/RpiR family transcriptional regulator [Glaciimonas immobilis]KAF3998868.1 MurR/RpiR family transcriptional regulator [Glaciimonas immobilis]MBB5198263.1 DNA-binding MurR/RpiR family transcriptional regulator [Glaciimonas immobilis]